MRPIDQSLQSDCFGFIKNFVFVISCDVANISNIYELVNFVFITLNDVANISNIYKLVFVYLW